MCANVVALNYCQIIIFPQYYLRVKFNKLTYIIQMHQFFEEEPMRIIYFQ